MNQAASRRLLVATVFAALAFAGRSAAPNPSPPLLRPLQEDRPPPALNAVVAEFLDAGATGLGQPVAYLLWREAFLGIRENRGAGIEAVRRTQGESLTRILERDYHTGAEQIAKARNAKLVLWGAVREEDKKVFIWTYLTALSDDAATPLSVKVRLGQSNAIDVDVDIARRRFSFAPIETTRSKLFSRLATVRLPTVLRADSDEHAKAIASLAPSTLLNVSDWSDEWLRVSTAGDRRGFVELWRIDLLPRQIAPRDSPAQLFATPNLRSATVAELHEGQGYDVADMRLVGPDRHAIAWFRVNSSGGTGWIQAARVRIRYSFPATHFLIGLQHFLGRRYADARDEMERFAEMTAGEADNVNRATALQIIGASEMMAGSPGGLENAFAYFSKAIALTPFDPSAYKLRALSAAGIPDKWPDVSRDVETALRLDSRDPRTQEMVAKLQTYFEGTSINSAEARAVAQQLHALR